MQDPTTREIRFPDGVSLVHNIPHSQSKANENKGRYGSDNEQLSEISSLLRTAMGEIKFLRKEKELLSGKIKEIQQQLLDTKDTKSNDGERMDETGGVAIVPFLLRVFLFLSAAVVITCFDVGYSAIENFLSPHPEYVTDTGAAEVMQPNNSAPAAVILPDYVSRYMMFVLTCILLHVMLEVEVTSGKTGGSSGRGRWLKRVINESITLWAIGVIIHNVEGFVTSVAAVGGIILTGNIFRGRRGVVVGSSVSAVKNTPVITEFCGREVSQTSATPSVVPSVKAACTTATGSSPDSPLRQKGGQMREKVRKSVHIFDHELRERETTDNYGTNHRSGKVNDVVANDRSKDNRITNKDTGEIFDLAELDRINEMFSKFGDDAHDFNSDKKVSSASKIGAKKKRATTISFFTPPRGRSKPKKVANGYE